MNYVLESELEANRLEKQNSLELYSVVNEMENIHFLDDEKIIDVGCGTCAVSLEVLRKNSNVDLTAVDVSDIRIQQTKNLLPAMYKDKIKFKCLDLMNDSLPENSFDVVISRFVLHHIKEPIQMLKSMKRILKPGGRLIIIDSDGILLNYFCNDSWLMKTLDSIRLKFNLDMYIGRKLKSYFNYIGLNSIQTKMIPMHFKDEALKAEIQQYRERFNIMQDFFVQLLGRAEAEKFINLYLHYLDNGSAELFYNKFIVIGHKI